MKPIPIPLDVTPEAEFDADHQNRFILRRTWNETLPQLACCLTNPSTAGVDRDDPTSRKMQIVARVLGYGSLVMVNAFSYCSPYPDFLRKRPESVETIEKNFEYICHAASTSETFLCGWGAWGALDGRSSHLRRLLQGYTLSALRLIKSGEPEHPLYLPMKLRPFVWINGDGELAA